MTTRRAPREARPVRRHTRHPRAGTLPGAEQPAAPKAAPADDPAAVAAGLRQSLEATHQGLQRFADSLRASGMADATPGYRQLRAVLVQQRLWAERLGRTELVPLFQAIAESAAAVRSILGPYSEVMAGLEDLDRITTGTLEPAPALAAGPRQDGLAGVVAALLAHGPSSPRRLAQRTGLSGSELAGGLRQLADAGLLRRTGWGRSVSYHLTDSFVQSALARMP